MCVTFWRADNSYHYKSSIRHVHARTMNIAETYLSKRQACFRFNYSNVPKFWSKTCLILQHWRTALRQLTFSRRRLIFIIDTHVCKNMTTFSTEEWTTSQVFTAFQLCQQRLGSKTTKFKMEKLKKKKTLPLKAFYPFSARVWYMDRSFQRGWLQSR